MTRTHLPTRPDELPRTIPIFPLSGVLLLPRGRLPLNVFEPRYLAMTDDALSGERMIGIIQPTESEGESRPTRIYEVGCAGRITAYSETEDGRYLITLTGVCRFDVVEELPTTRGYRRVVADWRRFAHDLAGDEGSGVDRERLVAGLRDYFRRHGLTVDWSAVQNTPDERLVTSLAMICPFAPNEKQALLEAPDLAERSRLLVALIEMASLAHRDDDPVPRH